MAFNGSGTYSLAQPAFVPGTVISSSAMNSDLSDIATNGLSLVICKDGQTTITGALKGASGSVGLPAYSFSADLDCGMYRIGANNIGLSVNGTKILDIATTGLTITGALDIATITHTGGTAIQGTNTNDSAAAGYVGQYIETIVTSGSPVSLTTATSVNIGSISLTAGDWDVNGVAMFSGNVATTVSYITASISQTTNTMDTTPGHFGGVYGANGSTATIYGANINPTISIPPLRISLSGTTTIYFVANSTFTTNSANVFGKISARRLR